MRRSPRQRPAGSSTRETQHRVDGGALLIWLSASKVIELARACFTRDSVIIYAKVMGRSFRGDYEDLYRRFHLRTDFDQLYQDVTAEDAGERLSAMAQQLGAEVTITLQPWKEVSQLTFPIPVPNNTNPL